MSTEETNLLNTIKKQAITGFITLIGMGVIAGMTFYYGTQNQLEEHEKAINNLQNVINEKVSKDEMNEFKITVREEIRSLHDDIKEVRDDNKKILEILSEK